LLGDIKQDRIKAELKAKALLARFNVAMVTTKSTEVMIQTLDQLEKLLPLVAKPMHYLFEVTKFHLIPSGRNIKI
jgi:hypothetical protein